jgi:hypothetical protein
VEGLLEGKALGVEDGIGDTVGAKVGGNSFSSVASSTLAMLSNSSLFSTISLKYSKKASTDTPRSSASSLQAHLPDSPSKNLAPKPRDNGRLKGSSFRRRLLRVSASKRLESTSQLLQTPVS